MKNMRFSFIKNLSIFKKMILSFCVIIVIPVLLSFIISARTTEDLIISQTYKDTLSSVELTTSSLSSLFNELTHAALYICNDEQVGYILSELNKDDKKFDGKDKATRMELLRKIEINISNVFLSNRIEPHITLLTKNGLLGYANYSTNESAIKNYLVMYGDKYFKNLDGYVNWVGIEQDHLESPIEYPSYVITCIKKVENKKDNSLSGFLIISVTINELVKLMSTESVPVKRVLVDNNLKIIASTEEKWLMKSLNTISNANVSEKEKGHITSDIFDGEKSILTYKKVNATGWIIVDIKPLSELSGALNNVWKKLLIFDLICVLVFLLIAAVIARGITVPLSRLSRAMLKTDLNVKSKPEATAVGDEISVLQYNFDVMRINLNLLMKENLENEKNKRIAELQALQSQISPHFLFNTLNAVRCAAETDKKEKVSEIIVALINLLKMTVMKGEALITLEQEVENLKNYVKILQMRHNTSFDAYFDIPDIISDYKIPKLLLQPLVENSIIHGFKGLTYTGIVEVTAEMNVDSVVIRVIDNGKGFDVNPLEDENYQKKYQFSGIGVANVDQRIKLHYGKAYGIQYIQRPDNGTIAEVTLPGL